MSNVIDDDGAALIARGATIEYADYRSALKQCGTVAALLLDAIGDFDALIVTIADEAPGRDSTGDGTPRAIWTACGVPTISLPFGRSPSGSPLSVGIVAAPGRDFALLEIAQRIEKSIAPTAH
jgi:Asp-tRNA(Asn)/Glu-tRNA(Gln) amidotransferase A subunit family amidase